MKVLLHFSSSRVPVKEINLNYADDENKGEMSVIKLAYKFPKEFDFLARGVLEMKGESRCQFHQHFTYKFFVQSSFFYTHVTRKSCQNATCVRNIRTFNVDEIDGRMTNSKKKSSE